MPPLRSPIVPTLAELLVSVLSVGAIALVAGGFQAASNKGWRHLGGPFTMALVGISFMLSAGVVALAELPDLEQLPPAGAPRLRNDREELEPGS